jgi:hypothetical protein
VPDVINTLRSAGLTVKHRRVSEDDGAPHLLIATPTPETSTPRSRTTSIPTESVRDAELRSRKIREATRSAKPFDDST